VTIVPGGIGAAAFAVFLNKAKWDSIPKRDQDLIMSVSGRDREADQGLGQPRAAACARKAGGQTSDHDGLAPADG
jgi:hypothetical protein